MLIHLFKIPGLSQPKFSLFYSIIVNHVLKYLYYIKQQIDIKEYIGYIIDTYLYYIGKISLSTNKRYLTNK